MHTGAAANPYDVAREVNADEFASLAADDQLVTLLNFAVLSPSPHNTQPWKWAVSDGTVRLYADTARLLRVSDPDARELEIGCGSALEHLLLAMAAFGVHGRVDQTGFDDPALLAEVTVVDRPSHLVAHTGLTLDDAPEAMLSRRTDRSAFDGAPVPDDILASLDKDATAHGIRLHTVTGEERPDVIRLIMDGDAAQMADPAFRNELSHWMRPAHSGEHDGMTADLLGQKGIAAEVAPLVVRTFDMGKSQSAKDEQLSTASPSLFVLGTYADDRPARLACGRFLARMLLALQEQGFAAAYMNQPCEMPELREQLANRLGMRHPQVVLRVGHSSARPHESLRRPVGEVLVT